MKNTVYTIKPKHVVTFPFTLPAHAVYYYLLYDFNYNIIYIYIYNVVLRTCTRNINLVYLNSQIVCSESGKQ